MSIQLAAANWKMNCTWQQAETLLAELMQLAQPLTARQAVVLAVPFPYLEMAKHALQGKANWHVAAQNCSHKKSGAYTGETSLEMLQSIGVEYVIIGHSERREYFNESNSMLAEKLSLALEYGITPIFCCGEPLTIREAGNENAFVALQLEESVYHLAAEAVSKIVIAYEPIWAIGTGKTASSQQAQDMHANIRGLLSTQYGPEVADQISILYGGSVKAANAAEIFEKTDVDGGLVGGASLVATEFAAIINGLKG
jgi:triosephosphate isomerase